MEHPLAVRRFVILVVLTVVASLSYLPAVTTGSEVSDGELRVTFFAVGQGDAILVETPDGVQVLIDGGPDATVVRQLAQALPWFDRTLDLVIGTHQDLDHVAGLVEVLARYQVGTVLMTEGEGASAAADAFLSAVPAEGAVIHHARAGQVFALGASTTLTVLSPSGDTSAWESNTGSVVALVRYGDTEFLLTGDAPEGIERYLAATYGAALEAEVLKLGHHGSDTSSSAEFLAVVKPQYAVVSAGRGNRYGHPHKAVLERVADHTNATIVSTQEGTVTFQSDGQRVWRQE